MSAAEIEVSLSRQELILRTGPSPRRYPVSTATRGAGELQHSLCTPRGLHRIRIRIGTGCPPNTVFVGRRPTGEICTQTLYDAQPGRDWILTRILWLSGLEPGRNRGGDRDTLRRYIYLHGSPDWVEMGQLGSHGCIRMRNADIVELFDLVEAGMRVRIDE